MERDRVPAAVVGVLATFALGLSAGAVLAEAAVLVPWWRWLPPEMFLAFYAAYAGVLFRFFGTLEIVAAVLAVAAAALHRRGPFLVSALLALAVLVLFPVYFRDVNAAFAGGSIALEHVAGELTRWNAWHWGRTVMAIAAFAAAVLGVRR